MSADLLLSFLVANGFRVRETRLMGAFACCRLLVCRLRSGGGFFSGSSGGSRGGDGSAGRGEGSGRGRDGRGAGYGGNKRGTGRGDGGERSRRILD